MKTKKVLAVIIAAVMLLMCSVTAFAESGSKAEGTTGTIELTTKAEGNEYSIYKIFDLISFDTISGNYSYKIETTSNWYDFIKNGLGANYVSVDEDGFVKWTAVENEANYNAFGNYALQYAKGEIDKDGNAMTEITVRIDPTATGIVDSSAAQQGDVTCTLQNGTDKTYKLTFSNLELGYYLVDSTVGTLVALNTTNAKATIEAKNEVPTVNKQVETSPGVYGASNTASIGGTVQYRTTVNVAKGALNYTLHDTMDNGLTLDPDSFEVYVGYIKGNASAEKVADTMYTVNTSTTDSCDFDVVLSADLLAQARNFSDSSVDGKPIYIYYTATLNENANIATMNALNGNPENGNVNTSWVSYGEKNTVTDTSSVTTYTFSAEIVKVNANGNTMINDAQFELYDDADATKGKLIPLVELTDESDDRGTYKVYRVASATEAAATDFTSATIVAGRVVIKGLGNNSYYLEETVAPNGFHKLTERKEIVISNANIVNTASMANALGDPTYTWSGAGVITNSTGAILPTTGGIGTTIFYIVGGVLVAGAVVFFIVRRRMNAGDKAK